MNMTLSLCEDDSSNYSSEAPPPYSRHAKFTTPPQQNTEHLYSLINKKAEWLTLQLMSFASSSNQLPQIHEGQPISGSLALNASNGGDAIQAITLRICGHISTGSGAQERVKFFQHIHPIWAKGDPLPEDGLPAKKLKEKHTWPFTFQLPSTFSLPEKYTNGESEVFRLPQTFFESKTQASIQYLLVVDVVRSALRRDSRLETSVVFVRNIQPAPPSLLCQRAYKTAAQFLPDDADSWVQLPSASISGRMADGHDVPSLSCVLSLANPLSYARGTALPCTLSVKCSDPRALDLVTPNSICVYLQRRINYIPCTTIISKPLNIQAHAHSKVEIIEFATWWPRKESEHHRLFHGEIYLEDSLQPTMSEFAYLSIEYSVLMRPFDPAGFSSNQPALAPISQTVVEIGNAPADGPRAIRYSTSRSTRPNTATIEKAKEDSGEDISSLEMLTKYYDGSKGFAPPALCAF